MQICATSGSEEGDDPIGEGTLFDFVITLLNRDFQKSPVYLLIRTSRKNQYPHNAGAGWLRADVLLLSYQIHQGLQ